MITMTKDQALKIQADQIAWYTHLRADLAERVAEITTADSLEDGVDYPVYIINRHIPRGASIERLAGLDPNRMGD